MLKYYVVNGKQYQYEEGEQPAGAGELIPLEKVKPSEKAETPANKAAAKPVNKARKAGSK